MSEHEMDGREVAGIWDTPVDERRAAVRPVLGFHWHFAEESHLDESDSQEQDDDEAEEQEESFYDAWSAALTLRYEGSDEVAGREVEIAVADGVLIYPSAGNDWDWFESLDDSEGITATHAGLVKLVGRDTYAQSIGIEVLGVDRFWRGGGVGPLLLAHIERQLEGSSLVTMEPGFVVAERRQGVLQLRYRSRASRKATPSAAIASWEAAGFQRYPFDCRSGCSCEDPEYDCVRVDSALWTREVDEQATSRAAAETERRLLAAADTRRARAWHRRIAHRLG